MCLKPEMAFALLECGPETTMGKGVSNLQEEESSRQRTQNLGSWPAEGAEPARRLTWTVYSSTLPLPQPNATTQGRPEGARARDASWPAERGEIIVVFKPLNLG